MEKREKKMFAHIHSHTQATGECLKRGKGDERESEESERVGDKRLRGWER